MLKVEIDARQARALVTGALERCRDASPVMADFAGHMETSVDLNFEQGGRPERWAPSKSEQTQQRSGRLRGSITSSFTATSMQIGTRLAYARQRQEGGPIVPVNARALAIPLQDWIRGGPRRYSGLVYIPPTKGKAESRGILGRPVTRGRGKNKREEIVPMFALRSRVVQPARPFLLFQAADAAYVAEQLAAFLTTGRLE